MNSQNKIAFLDLVTPHRELKEQLMSVLDQSLDTASFIGGPLVETFEADFARFSGCGHCAGVGNGTDALRFALAAAGVGVGDSVITVANTFIATTEAISQVGALPEFVDVDEAYSTMDPIQLGAYLEKQCDWNSASKQLRSKKTGRLVKAIIPVHLYGQTADMDPILELAGKFHLVVVEDACQAHGAEYFSRKQNRWRRAGSMGLAAAFSFYPGKNLGACGEAGAVTTNDVALATKVKMIRDHGQARKYFHDMEGYNGRLDAIQAGFLQLKLQKLEVANQQRRERAQVYDTLLAPLAPAIVRHQHASWDKPVYHLYVIRVSGRDELAKFLAEQGIGTGIHYPFPLHLQKAYQHLGYKEGDLPVTERLAKKILSLPMYPSLNSEQQHRVADQIGEFLTASDGKSGQMAATV